MASKRGDGKLPKRVLDDRDALAAAQADLAAAEKAMPKAAHCTADVFVTAKQELDRLRLVVEYVRQKSLDADREFRASELADTLARVNEATEAARYSALVERARPALDAFAKARTEANNALHELCGLLEQHGELLRARRDALADYVRQGGKESDAPAFGYADAVASRSVVGFVAKEAAPPERRLPPKHNVIECFRSKRRECTR